MTDSNPLAANREGCEDAEPRKAHYGTGAQPWDIALTNGWAACFAAANVLKYLRRDKNLEHSLESAQWYYARLIDGCSGKYSMFPIHVEEWQLRLDQLEMTLTVIERLKARGIT